MNSDRLVQMSSDAIVTGLTTKWTNAYSFLGFVFSATQTNNGVTFDSLNKNQFALDLSYYLELEDVLFLLFQTTDALIQVTNGTTIIQLTQVNLKQILLFKFLGTITQLNSTLNSVNIQDDYVYYNFTLLVLNFNDVKEAAVFSSETILTNYFEKYLSFDSYSLNFPSLIFKYKINWDVIKSRFSYRMDMGLPHNLFLEKEQINLNLNDKHVIFPYLDGNLTWDVIYQSSNTNIATVDSGGLVTPKSEGDCVITVIDNLYGISKTLNISVSSHQLKLSSSLLYIYGSETKKLSCFVDDNKTTNVTYQSSDESIATVDNSGNIVRKGIGTCVITVIDNLYGLTKSCKINTSDNVFAVNTQSLKLIKNKTFQLIPYFNGLKTSKVSYQSSDNSQCIVSSSGLITSITNDKSVNINIIITHISGMSLTIPVNVYSFDINKTNLVAYWSAVGKTNNDVNYSVWDDLTGNGYTLSAYTNYSVGTTGLFSNKITAGWQSNWFVFDSVSTANKGHWRITPSPILLTPGKNLVLGIRFKANYISGYPSMFSVRSSPSSPSFSFYQSQAQNRFQFETTTWDNETKFTYVNTPMTDTTIVIQTVSETIANIYINGVKTGTVKIVKNTVNNLFATIGAEVKDQFIGNFFNGAIKAIALYDVTSQLKTDAELVQLSQDLMALS